MPAHAPPLSAKLQKALKELGRRLRLQRKKLGVSATATAEAAGLSRVTLYRIEQGEPSVTTGAYMSVISALGFELDLVDSQYRKSVRDLTVHKQYKKIKLSDYPQLKQLAWQIKDSKEIPAEKALDLYERNWRHLDLKAMTPRERELLDTLLTMFGRERLLV